jgi:tetratricopeptide (TPR) repeat protein
MGLEHARRSVDLDDLLPFAHAILGWALLWSGDPRGAQLAGHRACALDPNNADAYLFLSMTLAVTDRAEDGLRCIEKGLRLNPYPSSFYFYALGLCHQMLGRYEEAIAAMKRGIEINPRFLPNQVSLPVLYELTGNHDEARAQMERAKTAISGWPNSLLFRYKPEFYRLHLDARRSMGMELTVPELKALESFSIPIPPPSSAQKRRKSNDERN